VASSIGATRNSSRGRSRPSETGRLLEWEEADEQSYRETVKQALQSFGQESGSVRESRDRAALARSQFAVQVAVYSLGWP